MLLSSLGTRRKKGRRYRVFGRRCEKPSKVVLHKDYFLFVLERKFDPGLGIGGTEVIS